MPLASCTINTCCLSSNRKAPTPTCNNPASNFSTRTILSGLSCGLGELLEIASGVGRTSKERGAIRTDRCASLTLYSQTLTRSMACEQLGGGGGRGGGGGIHCTEGPEGVCWACLAAILSSPRSLALRGGIRIPRQRLQESEMNGWLARSARSPSFSG